MLANQAQNLWLEELRVRSCSPSTISAHRSHATEAVAAIAAFLGKDAASLELSEITRDSVVASLAAYRSRPDGRSGKPLERSASSVGQHLTSIKAFLSWCVMTEKLTRNVASSVAAPKIAQRIPKAFSVESCKALLLAAGESRWPERDRLLVLCGLTLGLRLSEMSGLTLSSFRPSTVAPTHVMVLGKGSKERTLPVPEALRSALSLYLPTRSERLEAMGATSDSLFVPTRPYERDGVVRADATKDGVAQIFERILERADLKAPGLRVHVTRHSFATAGVSSRIFDLEEMRTLLGHSSVATTQIYLKVDPERLSESAERHPLAHLYASTETEPTK